LRGTSSLCRLRRRVTRRGRDPNRFDTTKKGLQLGFIVGVLSVPLGCVPFAIITGVPVMKLLAFSTVPHLVWGSVLGMVLGYGFASSASALE